MSKRKRVDPLPDEFSSYEEAAEFWGEHDTTNYPDAFAPEGEVVEAERLRRHYEVEVAPELAEELRRRARLQGVPVPELVSDLLRRQLALAS
jgi:predicted transcriptional regulator